jgi:hypothetical protein
MLPLAPYQPQLERTRVLLEGVRLNAAQEVDAVHARSKLEQRGRQHVLDLFVCRNSPRTRRSGCSLRHESTLGFDF